MPCQPGSAAPCPAPQLTREPVVGQHLEQLPETPALGLPVPGLGGGVGYSSLGLMVRKCLKSVSLDMTSSFFTLTVCG